MIKLEFKRGVIGKIDSDPKRWTVVGSLQEINRVLHVVADVLITEVWLVDSSELPGELRVGHRAPERRRRSHEMVAQKNRFVEELPLVCQIYDISAFDILPNIGKRKGILRLGGIYAVVIPRPAYLQA